MRGSTKLAETRLPFDTVFLVNRFQEAAPQALIGAGGQPNQTSATGCSHCLGSNPIQPRRRGWRCARLRWWHRLSNT
jgi:hypothetical protein